MLIDSFNRVHDYLRISITDNCNFRCIYCMPHENIDFTKQNLLMTPQEIGTIAKCFTDLGVSKIRITGGEPLFRKDFDKIIAQLESLPISLALTTNGLLLQQYLPVLLRANLKNINISLDSLKKEKFIKITQRDFFDKVWQNILLCLKNNLTVKLNVVLIKDYNEDELQDFIMLTKDMPINVRFIEYMPFADNNWEKAKVVSNQWAIATMKEKFPVFNLVGQKNDTDKKFGIIGHTGTVSFISTLTDSFCSSCNRLRITADGKIKNCLFGKDEFDLLTVLRSGGNLLSVIQEAVAKKNEKLGGQILDYTSLSPDKLVNRSMIKIGG